MIMKAIKIDTYVLGIQGDSEGNVHIFGSYRIDRCDKTFQMNMSLVLNSYREECI
jgi:hypothetical protein